MKGCKMSSRGISILMVLCMALCLLPGTARASSLGGGREENELCRR